ncbi:MAG: hypothetical protein AAFR87_29335 [Bacteroidota bacterium]
MKRIFYSVLLLLFLPNYPTLSAQSIFDKAEAWLKENHLQITYAHQLAWFKESHITFVQPEYGRDIIFENVKARDNPQSFSIARGEIGTSQFRVNIGLELSRKYSVFFSGTHLNYIVLTDNEYYRNGIWNGERVSGRVRLEDYFAKLEHSNGLNTYNLGLKRNFWISTDSTRNLQWALSVMPQVGAVFTGTQAGVYNSQRVYEHYDPGNIIAGYNYALDFASSWIFLNHLELAVNLNYFQMLIRRAKLSEDSYVRQKLRGFQYGLGLGYRF